MFTIANLERNADDGGVTVVHWVFTIEDGEYSSRSYGTLGCEPDPDSDDFVAFDSLTEADVIGWLEASLDVEAMTEQLTADIEAQKAPKSLSGLPW